MKKDLMTFAIAMLISLNMYPQPCDLPTSVIQFIPNNLSASIIHGEQLFTNTDDLLGLEAPAGSGKNLIYSTEFWFSGRTPDQQLKLAAGYGDYFAGPLQMSDASVDLGECMLYDQFYVLFLEQSLTHIEYQNSVIAGTEDVDFPDGYTTPDVFYDYPGQGNIGQAQLLAPFFDYNGDENYNPDDGDCPMFDSMITDSGVCVSCEGLGGDISIFWITNDKGNLHTNSNGQPIGIEIHNIIYAFIGQTGVLDNTLFIKKKIINRGTQTLTNCFGSLMLDADIGGGFDDYVGCDVNRNLAYTYNGDAYDEGSLSSDGYEFNPPTLGVLTLSGLTDDMGNDALMSGFMSFNNSTDVISGFPITAAQFYNYQSGFWRDGSDLTCGENGYSGTTTTDYIFPGTSNPTDDCENWSEVTAANFPGDRRMLVNSSLDQLSPGDEHCMQYAMIYAEDLSENGSSLEELFQLSDTIQDLFDDCFMGVSTDIKEFDNSIEIDFLWSPSIASLSVNDRTSVSIYNSLGQIVLTNSVQNSHSINLSFLNNGIYFVQFELDSGLRKTYRILVE